MGIDRSVKPGVAGLKKVSGGILNARPISLQGPKVSFSSHNISKITEGVLYILVNNPDLNCLLRGWDVDLGRSDRLGQELRSIGCHFVDKR